jgi:hypothetical protein
MIFTMQIDRKSTFIKSMSFICVVTLYVAQSTGVFPHRQPRFKLICDNHGMNSEGDQQWVKPEEGGNIQPDCGGSAASSFCTSHMKCADHTSQMRDGLVQTFHAMSGTTQLACPKLYTSGVVICFPDTN